MDRQKIMQEIAKIDRQIHEEAGKNKLPSLNTRNASFPLSSWIAAAVIICGQLFFDSFIPEFFPQQDLVILGIGGLLALFALIATFKWITFKSRVKAGLNKQSPKIEELNKKKRALQEQLDSAS